MKLPFAVLTLLLAHEASAQWLARAQEEAPVEEKVAALDGIGPWRDKWSQVPALNERGYLVLMMTTKAGNNSGWEEVNGHISRMTGVPNAVLSPEYAHYRAGTKVMMVSGYGPDSEGIDISEEFSRAYEASGDGRAKRADLKGPEWIHMVQPLTQAEVNCLTISIKDGNPVGCGDQWQTGITEDKLACFKGQTYLRCHLDCIERIYQRDIDATPGACHDERAALVPETPAPQPSLSDEAMMKALTEHFEKKSPLHTEESK